MRWKAGDTRSVPWGLGKVGMGSCFSFQSYIHMLLKRNDEETAGKLFSGMWVHSRHRKITNRIFMLQTVLCQALRSDQFPSIGGKTHWTDWVDPIRVPFNPTRRPHCCWGLSPPHSLLHGQACLTPRPDWDIPKCSPGSGHMTRCFRLALRYS